MNTFNRINIKPAYYTDLNLRINILHIAKYFTVVCFNDL